jgi:nitrite reductase/ring-hydroxylating ferredoxin subunit
MGMTEEPAWWPLALSREVTADAPLARTCGEAELALFRDASGKVCAVEDRCPHRRAPLSLGKMINGDIRCPYHGWTFSGASGACVAIPNLRPDEPVPPRYRIETYRVHEADGLVWVSLSGGEAYAPPEPEMPAIDWSLSGSVQLATGIEIWRQALSDGPQTLLAIRGIGITSFYLGDPLVTANHIITERGAAFTPKGREPSRFLPEYPMLMRIQTARSGGDMRIELEGLEGEPLAAIRLGASPGARDTTRLVWQAGMAPALVARAPLRLRLALLAGRPWIRVFDRIDGAGLAGLPPGASRDQPAPAVAAQPVPPLSPGMPAPTSRPPGRPTGLPPNSICATAGFPSPMPAISGRARHDGSSMHRPVISGARMA